MFDFIMHLSLFHEFHFFPEFRRSSHFEELWRDRTYSKYRPHLLHIPTSAKELAADAIIIDYGNC
jgi:hypothetical protein